MSKQALYVPCSVYLSINRPHATHMPGLLNCHSYQSDQLEILIIAVLSPFCVAGANFDLSIQPLYRRELQLQRVSPQQSEPVRGFSLRLKDL